MKAKALAILIGHLATKPAAAANFGGLLSTHRAPRVLSSASNPDRGDRSQNSSKVKKKVESRFERRGEDEWLPLPPLLL